MARGHRLNTSIVLAAAHGLLGLPGRCARSSLHTLAPFHPLSPSLISILASVDIKQNVYLFCNQTGLKAGSVSGSTVGTRHSLTNFTHHHVCTQIWQTKSYIKRWTAFCSQRDENPFCPSPAEVLKLYYIISRWERLQRPECGSEFFFRPVVDLLCACWFVLACYAELCPKSYWRGPRSQGVEERCAVMK